MEKKYSAIGPRPKYVKQIYCFLVIGQFLTVQNKKTAKIVLISCTRLQLLFSVSADQLSIFLFLWIGYVREKIILDSKEVSVLLLHVLCNQHKNVTFSFQSQKAIFTLDLKNHFIIYFLENKLIYSPGHFDFFVIFWALITINHNHKLEADMKEMTSVSHIII